MKTIHAEGVWDGERLLLHSPAVSGLRAGTRVGVTLEVPDAALEAELEAQASGLRSVLDALGPEGMEIAEEENVAPDLPRLPL